MTTEFKLTPEQVAAIEALVIELSKTGARATETRLRGKPSHGSGVAAFQAILKLLGIRRPKSELRARLNQGRMTDECRAKSLATRRANAAAFKAWKAAGRPGLDATSAQ